MRFNTQFENSDQFGIDVQDNDELLARPFRIASDVTIQTGAYAFQDVFASYSVGPRRRFSGTFSIQRGEFFSSSTDSLTPTSDCAGSTSREASSLSSTTTSATRRCEGRPCAFIVKFTRLFRF